MTRHARAQIASMDIIISVIVLLLFTGTVAILAYHLGGKEPNASYGGLVFTNLESIDTAGTDFLKDYKVDDPKLAAFSSQAYADIRQTVIEGTEYGPGHEVCIFFLNQSSPLEVGGADSFGHASCSHQDPCGDYVHSFVHVKPVLRQREVVNMYVVLCQ